MIWRAIVGPCPKCGLAIGVTDYPTGVWGVARCEGCGSTFSAYEMGKHYPTRNVDEAKAKQIKTSVQSIFHIRTEKIQP